MSATAASSTGRLPAAESSSNPSSVACHADHERVRRRPSICVETDDRLEQRRRELLRKGDQTNLREAQLKRRLEDRVNRGNERLDRVVEQMREADRRQHAEERLLPQASWGGEVSKHDSAWYDAEPQIASGLQADVVDRRTPAAAVAGNTSSE